MSAGADFEFVEGATSDLSFVARGPTPEAAIAAAAEALLAATVEDPDAVRRTQTRSVAVAEPELELALLHFLNELVYLRDAEQLLLHATRVRLYPGASLRLEAELAGEPIDRARHRLLAEVKAATAHGLAVERTAAGFEARVTLDV
jgi:SHS2 domain-containing protein